MINRTSKYNWYTKYIQLLIFFSLSLGTQKLSLFCLTIHTQKVMNRWVYVPCQILSRSSYIYMPNLEWMEIPFLNLEWMEIHFLILFSVYIFSLIWGWGIQLDLKNTCPGTWTHLYTRPLLRPENILLTFVLKWSVPLRLLGPILRWKDGWRKGWNDGG